MGVALKIRKGMAAERLWNKGMATQGPGPGSWAQWIQGPRALGPVDPRAQGPGTIGSKGPVPWDQWIQGPRALGPVDHRALGPWGQGTRALGPV